MVVNVRTPNNNGVQVCLRVTGIVDMLSIMPVNLRGIAVPGRGRLYAQVGAVTTRVSMGRAADLEDPCTVGGYGQLRAGATVLCMRRSCQKCNSDEGRSRIMRCE